MKKKGTSPRADVQYEKKKKKKSNNTATTPPSYLQN
jgi:hypothetical protein